MTLFVIPMVSIVLDGLNNTAVDASWNVARFVDDGMVKRILAPKKEVHCIETIMKTTMDRAGF